MLRTCSRPPFLVKTSGELPLYMALNREIINVEVRSKEIKNCLKYILILLTLYLTFCDVRLMAKESVVVDDKTRTRVFMCVFGTWIVILSFLFGRPLNYLQDVVAFRKDVFLSKFGFYDYFRIRIRRILSAFRKDVRPLVFKWLKQYYM